MPGTNQTVFRQLCRILLENDFICTPLPSKTPAKTLPKGYNSNKFFSEWCDSLLKCIDLYPGGNHKTILTRYDKFERPKKMRSESILLNEPTQTITSFFAFSIATEKTGLFEACFSVMRDEGRACFAGWSLRRLPQASRVTRYSDVRWTSSFRSCPLRVQVFVIAIQKKRVSMRLVFSVMRDEGLEPPRSLTRT